MTVAKQVVPKELLDGLLSDYRKPEDLIGENGLLKQLTKLLVERALEAEIAGSNNGAPDSEEADMRLLHTMLRTGDLDLDRAIAFYTEVLGMQLLRRQDYPEGKFTLAFVGYGIEKENTVIELTYNWGVDHYDLGKGFGHIAIEVDDVYAACAEIKRRGGTVVREAGPMNAGTTIIAFVADPDGYYIELIGKRA